MYRIKLIGLFVLLCLVLAGCGETIQGAGKDIKRIGESTRRIFVRD